MKTHAQLQKERQLSIQEQIMKMLQITDDEYQMNRFEMVYPYLDRVTAGYKAIISQLTSDELFWKWWLNQFTIIDDEFIKLVKYNMPYLPLEGCRVFYYKMHVNMAALPDSIIYRHDREYSKMVTKVIDNHVK